ncbi:MAG: ATP phosphoribosyltransferase regulatory subunit, partial [Elusimicrobia bacterium]|nr:ATP phosphoribosyltransferase regulatory subunit [Elusimicrobiota bacterium]
KKYLKKNINKLCNDCKNRIEKNPLRALDCKREKPEIKEGAPRSLDSLCPDCRNHFGDLQGYLKQEGIIYSLDPYLVRGLDYYNRTAFEVVAQGIGSQDAIAGGGRYDTLVESMGGPATPAVGWAMGVDRSLLTKGESQKDHSGPIRVFVAAAEDIPEAKKFAFGKLQELRQQDGYVVGAGSFHKSLKAQFREAEQFSARYILIYGEDEVKTRKCTIKDFSTGSQKQIPDDVQSLKKELN